MTDHRKVFQRGGVKLANGKLVTGDYCRSDLDGCWIGSEDKSGYWEAKVRPETVKEIKDED